MKRHLDCDWLIEFSEGVYCCCDNRSTYQGRKMNKEEARGQACEFFHVKKSASEKIFLKTQKKLRKKIYA